MVEKLLGLRVRRADIAGAAACHVRHVRVILLVSIGGGSSRCNELLVVFEGCERLIRVEEGFITTGREHHSRYVRNCWVGEIGRQRHGLIGGLLHGVGRRPRSKVLLERPLIEGT